MSNPFLTPSQGSGATPAGWYPDPEGSGRQQYWNGSTWEPVPAPSRSWLTSWPAIIVGLFLCLIPGIILLWMRPGTSPKIKAGVTVGAVLLALLFSTLGGKPANQVASPSLPPDPSLVSPTPNWVTPSAESLAPTPSETSTPSPSNGVAGASAALLLALDALPVKGRAPKTGYSRALFGVAWADVDGNGCDTRDDVLAATLIGATAEANCTVISGTLHDNYTDVSIPFDTAVGIDVDHIVALSDAWQKGAQKWAPAQRLAFANDPLNLQPTLAGVNQSKSDSDVASWLPPNPAYRCDYVARIIAVKSKYGLWITPAEKTAMLKQLKRCDGTDLPDPGTQGIIAPAAAMASAFAATAPTPATPKPTPTPTDTGGTSGSSSGQLDPQFRTCKAAKSAGYGPYISGVNPEYDWYRDADHDGRVCE